MARVILGISGIHDVGEASSTLASSVCLPINPTVKQYSYGGESSYSGELEIWSPLGEICTNRSKIWGFGFLSDNRTATTFWIDTDQQLNKRRLSLEAALSVKPFLTFGTRDEDFLAGVELLDPATSTR